MNSYSHFSSHRLLVGITGSLGILATPSLLTALGTIFGDVRVIMTPAACTFIPAKTMQHLCRKVYTDEDSGVSHIELARWADHFIVLPTTANTLGQVAQGLAENLLTQTILAYKGVVFFPNMNQMMWEKRVVQRNIELIQEDGHEVYIPELQECFEQASQSMRKNIVLPNIQELLDFLLRCRLATLHAPSGNETER